MEKFRIACVGASICCGQTAAADGINIDFHPFVDTTTAILEKHHIRCEEPLTIGEPGLFTWQILQRMRPEFEQRRHAAATAAAASRAPATQTATEEEKTTVAEQPAASSGTGFGKFLAALKCRLVPVKKNVPPPPQEQNETTEPVVVESPPPPQLFDMVCILAGTNNLGEGTTAVEAAIKDVVEMVLLAEEALAMPVLITLPGIEEPWYPEHHECRVVFNALLLAIADASVTGSPASGGEGGEGESPASPATHRTPIGCVDLWRASATSHLGDAPMRRQVSGTSRAKMISYIERIWKGTVAPAMGFGHYKITEHVERLLGSGIDDDASSPSVLEHEVFLAKRYSSDGLHMSKEGYEMLGGLVADVLVPRAAE